MCASLLDYKFIFLNPSCKCVRSYIVEWPVSSPSPPSLLRL